MPATAEHILLFNNSVEILRLLTGLLEPEGYRVTSHLWVDRNLPVMVDDPPDLIILDYQWASSDDDWTMLQILRLVPETSKVPIILCTAAVEHVRETEQHLFEMDIDVVLKPFDIEQLLGVVRSRLARSRAGVPSDQD